MNLRFKRIAIIAHPLHAGGGISIGRNFIATLKQVAPDNEYFVSIPNKLGYEQLCDSLPNCKKYIFKARTNLLKRWWWETLVLRPAIINFEPDIVISLANKGLGGLNCPEAILCHNPYIWHSSQFYGSYDCFGLIMIKLKTLIQRKYLQKSLNNPKNILLCQTETALKRIHQEFKVNSKFIIFPNAVSQFSIIKDYNYNTPDIMHSYSDRFRMLFITRYYPHKNIEILIDLFRKHQNELHDCVIFLTLSTDHGSRAKKLLKLITYYNLNDKLINIGPIPQEQLGTWFCNSDALIMPTLLESYSGSYLEAMHFGTPILTSDLDFAHEICGDAAQYFNPWDTQSLCDSIIALRDTPEQKLIMRDKGHIRLQSLLKSWPEIIEKLFKDLDLISSETNQLLML